jgi:3-oxoacyl-[acyl-carrier protein] reductase
MLKLLLPTKESQDAAAQACWLKKIGLPEDVALAAIYLASEASAYVTGQIIHLDGGMTA